MLDLEPAFRAMTDDIPTSEVASLVNTQSETLTREAIATAPASTTQNGSNTLTSEMGDYIVNHSHFMFLLADFLANGPHVQEVVAHAHEQARRDNHVSDTSSLVLIDLHLTKLR